ncbi:Uncharacterised protein [Klebsiella pneumoniae]|uniref:Uncharacterized protein n=1 Tax=Klebsiella pneumoniae TaxID=573 RepID=A0A447RK67_KLEPN|nr:Uncharacterised protein [Klebsiella pneumoniae]
MIRTQLQAVSTTTGAGKLFAQLAINIVIRHMANGLLYIACLFRDFCLTFCCGDGSGGILFGTLLIGFGFCLTGPASVANTERTSYNRQQKQLPDQ